MLTLGPLGFTAPWLLLGLAALPILWLILRAVPPAPIERRFPGVALLLGLTDRESQTDRTPWWLLLLRLLAAAAIIAGFAGPVLNPQEARGGRGDLLILVDGSWAGAPDWPLRRARIEALLTEAAAADRRTALVLASAPPDDGGLPFAAPADWSAQLPGLEPRAWQPGEGVVAWAEGLTEGFETWWLSDGLDYPARADLLAALEARGRVTAFQTPRGHVALRPVAFDGAEILLSATRSPTGAAQQVTLNALGRDPAGVERVLAVQQLDFAAGEAEVETRITLPPELRNRVTRFELAGHRSAGAVTLTDDAALRREVALIAGDADREAIDLLSPLHYLREALAPAADVIEGALADMLPANPDVIVLADVAQMPETEAAALQDWVEAGGMLLRFAGPRLAASDIGRSEADPLLPVRLRAGGRDIGGAMSWGAPKPLAPFAEDSPFAGLAVPEDVTVKAQVMAQPDPDLASRVIAQLADGTPLVTRKPLGEGQIVLFHVTANAEWSSLPLSGLFVEMLERLAISTRPAQTEADDLAGTTWLPLRVLDGFGGLQDGSALPGVPGERLAEGTPGPDLRPGLYSGDDRQIAVNAVSAETVIAPARWPDRIAVEGLETVQQTPLKGWLLALALLALAVDAIASLAVGGRLRGPRPDAPIAALLVALLLAPLAPPTARAQEAAPIDEAAAIAATSQVVLAHVLTGDAEVDEQAEAGLRGLGFVLFRRTAVEPAAPQGVDLERDELAFYPFLYWPITPDQPLPSREAYAKLNRYLQSGGMILFDTRDGDTAGFGSASPEGRRLQAIARTLDIPPLEPIPDDHVLTRTFYLLQDFPGRHASRDVWVEAAPPGAEAAEGAPFRTLNDGVTPVIIGGNDWARAWAVDEAGNRMFPVGRGTAGERQREIAYRFGVNVIMHVLTGNYKSDQVHVPDLLDRLSQ